MNWEKIQNECPKGYLLLVQWRENNISGLFDFFDSREIYINVMSWDAREQIKWNFDILYKHDDGDFSEFCVKEESDSRPEAESAAFEKAFQILEERLNKEA